MKKLHKAQMATLFAVFMAFVITACSSSGPGASQNAGPVQASNEEQTVEADKDTSQNAVAQAQEAETAVSQTASTSATAQAAEKAEAINYLALVNKLNPLPDGWEDALETIHMTNSVGDDVEVEKKAYDAYLKLKEDLEKEGIFVDLDSARRSVAEQQRIMDDFTQKSGAINHSSSISCPSSMIKRFGTLNCSARVLSNRAPLSAAVI